MCLVTAGKPREVKDFVEELLKHLGKWELHDKIKTWNVPKFPVDGNMLKRHNCPSGKIMGTIVNILREQWVKSEFKSTSDELLLLLPNILVQLNFVDGKQVKKTKTQ